MFKLNRNSHRSYEVKKEHFDMVLFKQSELTKQHREERTKAVYRHVWMLTQVERQALDIAFLVWCSADTLDAVTDIESILTLNGIQYTVVCDWDNIEDNTNVFLSFRYKKDTLAYCVVQPTRFKDDELNLRWKELEV